MDRGWLETIRRTLRQRLWVSVALVTLLTLGLVGAVVLTTTSAGCGPANWLHVKTTHCPANLAANLGGVTPSPAGAGLRRLHRLPGWDVRRGSAKRGQRSIAELRADTDAAALRRLRRLRRLVGHDL